MLYIDGSLEQLLARSLSEDLTGPEKDRLREWLDASRENREYYTSLKKIYQSADAPEPDFIPDIDASWKDLSERLNLEDESSHLFLSGSSSRKRLFINYAVAAAAVLVFFLVYLSVLRQDSWNIETTAHGQHSELNLADNSTVIMNAGSTLRYPDSFTDSVRLVRLQGQAFFDISGSEKPFVVQTENAQIRVLGTRFDVFARNQRTEVIVEEGKVRLTSVIREMQNNIILEPDQMGIVNKKNQVRLAREENADFLIGWLHNRFVFYKTPLGEALAEMERRHDVSIRLADNSLKARTMSGSFEDTSVRATLEAFCLALNLSLIKEDDTYIISAK